MAGPSVRLAMLQTPEGLRALNAQPAPVNRKIDFDHETETGAGVSQARGAIRP